MPSSFINLPTELHLKIAEQLLIPRLKVCVSGIKIKRIVEPDKSLKNWSCTCSYFRDMLAPYIFETVKLRNDDNSAMSMLELSESRHNRSVKELHFVGSAPGDLVSADIALTDIEAVFPDKVDKVLSELRRFPILERVGISFVYPFEDDHLSLDLCNEEEDDGEVQKAEKEKAWRALMARTYSALTRNEAINFKALEITDLAPCRVSTFDDPAFHYLLSRLESFTLSIFKDDDNGDSWFLAKHHYYEQITAKLDAYFFNHLPSATAFTLRASEMGPLGGIGRYAQLALDKEQMPFLKRLDLDHIFVCPELIDFLLAHLQTLEHVTLGNCASSIDFFPENPIPWRQLFNALADANPQHLIYFNVTHMTTSFHTSEFLSAHERLYGEEKDWEKSLELMEKIRRILEVDESRELCYNEYQEFLVSFHRSEDQASYERLVRIVDANAKRGIAGQTAVDLITG